MTSLKTALTEAYDHACSMNITTAESLENYIETFQNRTEDLNKLELSDPFQKTLDIAKAIGSPIRLKILLFTGLSETTCFCELEAAFALEQSTLTYHLNLLHRANLIVTRKQGKWKIFALNSSNIENIQNVISSLLNGFN